jgi:LmbE family N-acetylglucosaminyl deacetylase
VSYSRVLVVAAHPDDPEYLFGATVARLAADGAELRYVICTDGSLGGRDPAMSQAELTETRYAEQRAAADVLGVGDVVFLGFPDGGLAVAERGALHRAIVREIRRFRPELVITHFPRRALDIPIEASHPDHVAAGEATLHAIFPAATNARSYPELLAEGLTPHRVKEVWVPGYEGSNHVVDATSVMDKKSAAILCHRSQLDASTPGTVPPWVYWWMKRSGTNCGYEYAEEFKRVAM